MDMREVKTRVYRAEHIVCGTAAQVAPPHPFIQSVSVWEM